MAAIALAAPAAAQGTLPPGTRAVVMPFHVASREPLAFWVGEGSAIALSDALAAAGVSVVPRDARIAATDGLRVASVPVLSHALAMRVAQVVDAGIVVVGAVEIENGGLRVRTRALVVDAGLSTGEIVEAGMVGELFGVVRRVAARLTATDATAAVPSPTPLAAFERYVRGLLSRAPAGAVELLTQALAQAPSFHDARLARARAYAAVANPRSALADARLVPATHALSRPARFVAALALLDLARNSEAATELVALQAASPNAAVANNLGVVQLRRPPGSPGGRAVIHFSEATRLEPDDPDHFFNLGYAHWLDGSHALATDALREAVRRDPTDASAHYVLAAALAEVGQQLEAARERALAQRLSTTFAPAGDGTAVPVPRGLERLKLSLDRLVLPERAQARSDQRDAAAFHVDAGRRLFEAGRDTEAAASLRRAVFLSPYDAAAHVLLGRLHLRAGRWRDAADALTIAVWSSDTIEARVLLAEALVALKDVPAARTELRVVLDREPQHIRARELVAALPPP